MVYSKQGGEMFVVVLKLTSTGHYGIAFMAAQAVCGRSEVDLNRSLWYTISTASSCDVTVLKLTSTGHYGIHRKLLAYDEYKF